MRATADPLAALRGLHVPASPAAGWSGMAVAVGIGVAAAVLQRLAAAAWRRWRSPRAAALAALAATRPLPGPERVAAQAGLLRRLVQARAGQPASSERGAAWLARLDAEFGTRFFSHGAGQAFGEALYRPIEADAARLDAALIPLLRRLRRR